MKKIYLLMSLLMMLSAIAIKSSAQNNLAAGDIAIVSYQSDTDPTNTFNTALLEFDDRFSIVVLRPGGLTAGTVIYFTDRGWDGPNNIWLDESYPPFTFGIGSEAVIKWVVPAGGIIQGKEVFFINKYHDELAAGSEYYQWFAYSNENGTVPLGTITNETPIVPTALPQPNGYTDGMSLFSAGDNILIFQTGPPAGAPTNYNDATRRFITAILANVRPTNVGTPTSYVAWDVTPNVQNESSIPPGLVNGQTCFLMSPGPLPHPTSPVPGTVEPDNGKFSACGLSSAGACSALQMAAIIYNITNWTYQNTVFAAGTSSSQCTYNVLSTNMAGGPSSTPTLCINTLLTNITHATTVATGIGAATGLPAGVTAAWAANTITISGTPTVSGTFNYTIPLTGGCGSVNATGTITVTPNKTVSGPSSTPTLCVNTLMTSITHTTTGATGIGTPTGLPAGVTAGFAANTITISGTPTASGTFSYTIPLTGGCGSVNATGTINVNPTNTITLTGNGVTIADGDAIPSSTDHTDFGSVNIDSSFARTYTIQNTGNATLTVSSITITGTNAIEFAVSGISLPATIAGLGSTTFTITFTPTAFGTRTATIHVNNNDCNKADYNYAVQGIGTASTLPITLSSVKAYQKGVGIAVEWKVQNEAGIKSYEIEKSAEGRTFSKAATQVATGNNNSNVDYNWLDANVITGNNFYRIRSVSLNSEVKYSTVVKVTISKGKTEYAVYPNPLGGNIINLQFINQQKGTYIVRLNNNLGQLMQSQQITHQQGSSTEAIELNSSIQRGHYVLEVIAPDKSKQSIKIIY